MSFSRRQHPVEGNGLLGGVHRDWDRMCVRMKEYNGE